jgi:hypothetical protein
MRRWMVRVLVGRVYGALRQGNPEPALRMFRPDTRFRFAGSHSWAIDTNDAAEVRSWCDRTCVSSTSWWVDLRGE